MARSTMTELIEEVRGMTNAGTADYTVGTITFWADDDLQEFLDANRTDYKFLPLTSVPDYSGGTISIRDYKIPFTWYESGTALGIVDNQGNAYGTALYSVDSARNMIRFTNNTLGSTVAVNINTFDLNQSAADIWTRKAAHYAAAYDVSTDNHSLKRSQLVQQAREMSKHYANLSYSTGANGMISAERGDM